MDRTNIPAPSVVGQRSVDRLPPSLVDATCDMHRHAGASAVLLVLVEDWPADWPAHIRDNLMWRADSHQRHYTEARARYLAAGGEPTLAEREAAEHNALLLDGARDALDEAQAFGDEAEVDRAKARYDAVRRSVLA